MTENGEDISKAPVTDATVKKLPLRQRLYLEYRPLLYDLTTRYPNVHLSISDKSLSENLIGVLDKVGFSSHFHPGQDVRPLVSNLIQWLKRNNLVLIHYKPQYTKTNVIHLLRQLQKADPGVKLTGLVPVFIRSVTPRQQLEIFRMLGGFGVKYAMFLSTPATPDQNLEELLEGLVDFSDMLNEKVSVEEEEVKTSEDWNTGKIDEYKQLYTLGEELMIDGKYEEAIETFSKAIDMKPDFDLLMDRGDAFFKMKKYVPALKDYRQAHRLSQDVPKPHAKIGACCMALLPKTLEKEGKEAADKVFHMAMKNLKTAEELIDKQMKEAENAPEKAPASPYAPILNALAEADIRGVGMQEAENEILAMTSRYLERTKDEEYADPKVPDDAKIDRGVLLARGGYYGEAEKIFRSVISKNPDVAGPAFNNFAVELRKNGKNGKAFEIYLEVLNYKVPDKDIIIENLKTAGLRFARDLREQFRGEDAIKVYKKILTQKPAKQEWVLCELAQTYMELQDKPQASLRLMEAIFMEPELTHNKGFEKYQELSGLVQEIKARLG